MVRIQQLKLPISHTVEELEQKLAKALRLSRTDILNYQIRKQSIDARKKNEVMFVYTIDVTVQGDENKIISRAKNNHIAIAKDVPYQFPVTLPYKENTAGKRTVNSRQHTNRPVIIGSGPAGLFCGYMLAEHGFCPIIIERGKPVEERQKDVEEYWNTNALNPHSNVQFGEGGAGTFSDGKLNTLVKDVKGRNKKVLDIFIRHGAPETIGYVNKPHIGTDILIHVVSSMRKQIELWGGTYLFETCVTDFAFDGDILQAVICEKNNNPGKDNVSETEQRTQPKELLSETEQAAWAQSENQLRIETDTAVLAIGHSARDTFAMLEQKGFQMEAKSFAVGMRVEHPQSMIDENQYGRQAAELLPPASYKLTANLANGRGVYSFCMCPGGFVVNASSEEKRLAVNGMSYSKRDGKNANSAIIVTVTPEDFGGNGPLSGVEFQRRLEEKAYALGNGSVPQQLFGDFEQQRVSEGYGAFSSEIKGKHQFGALHTLFSREITEAFQEGMHQFARYIPDFDRPDAILSGVESRTSSPVRITRDENFESNKKGIYPCGEGAGYAGGIMSAAMDGLKIAEAIAGRQVYDENLERE